MELVKSHKHRSRISEAMYVILNIALAGVMFAATYVSNAPWIALVLIGVGKWRIFAVRPRFWAANIIANMVDVLVSLSYVMFLYRMTGYLGVQIALTVLYAIWLLFIKPRSKYGYIVMQAGTALFLGLTTLSMLAFEWNVAYFVVGAWVIGYVAAHHVMNKCDEPYNNLYSLTVGLVVAELGWISFHWMVAYSIPGFESIRLSQFALFATLICFVAERAYRSHRQHGEVRRIDIVPPIVFTALIMLVMFIFAAIYGSDAL